MGKRKAENPIADLVQDVKEANGNTDQTEGLHMAVAFPDEPESDQDERTGQGHRGYEHRKAVDASNAGGSYCL